MFFSYRRLRKVYPERLASDQEVQSIRERIKSIAFNCFGQFKQTLDAVLAFWKTIEKNGDPQRGSRIVRSALGSIDFDDFFVLEDM